MTQAEEDFYIIEERQPFAESKLWQLQTAYFDSVGIEAWRRGEVPHYVTSNPVMGKTYAEIVFAFLRDLSQRGLSHEKVYLLELGAGHGRLCYHFLKHFEKLVETLSTPTPEFCYVLSDFTEANLNFWKTHPRFEPYLEKGWIDFAQVDATQVTELNLAFSGKRVVPDSLEQPLIIVANYFFDSIPHELFYIKEKELYRCLVSLKIDKKYKDGTPAEILKNVRVDYENERLDQSPFHQDYLNKILSAYVENLSETYLLFPHTGIECLHRLRRLSKKGVLVLTADKGFHHEEDLHCRPAPQLVTHGGCFSLSVNYHAFKEYCLAEGGLPLFPRHMQFSLNLGCLLLLPEHADYNETQLAYERFVDDFGPDDYYSLKTLIQNDIQGLSFKHIMGAVRLSGYDARLFDQMLPRLRQLLAKLSTQERGSLFQAIHRIWDTYYPLGEDRDLAFNLGELLVKLEFHSEAIVFFQRSIETYGKSLPVLYNLALCNCQLQQYPQAESHIAEILQIDPEHKATKELIASLGENEMEPLPRSSVPSDLRRPSFVQRDPKNTDRANAISLKNELTWFSQVLETRISLYLQQRCEYGSIYDIPPLDLEDDDSEYARLVKECGMSFDERIVLILTLIPHIRPQALDILFTDNQKFDRGYTEFGGWKGKTHGGFLPTCETAAFILAGNDMEKRFEILRLFEDDHFLASKGILRVEHQGSGEPFFSGALRISTEYLNRLTSGVIHKPDYNINFPAKLIITKLDWEDLVLAPEVLEEIENINTWMRHSKTILEDWGLEKSIKPGYRSLFYGPPGTGKTLTATLIGASAGVDVYRIDLSMVVSKYIGETEKNLANVFDQAQNKNWILFFDEADALFGKRTQTSSSHDRYANQEVSYLLQRVEDFPGVVILATNMKANIDDAFARRFQSFVYFPMPDAEQRLRLWEGMLNGRCRLAEDVRLAELAEDYELSGGAITNVVRYGAIRALQRNEPMIAHGDLLKGISKERFKEGKTT